MKLQDSFLELTHRFYAMYEKLMSNRFSFFILPFGVVLFYFLFLLSGKIPNPDEINLIMYDAGWYDSIAKSGYVFKFQEQCNLAFFPLFPMTWRFLSLNPVTVSILNGGVILLTLWLMMRGLHLTFDEILRYFVSPSLIFCFLPFSESFFYFSSALIIIGLYRNSNGLLFLGVLLAGLSRSVSVFIIPMIFFAFLPSFIDRDKRVGAFRNFLLLVFSALFSLLLVGIWQYIYTKRWFEFLTVQKYWNKNWQIPEMPLTTWGFEEMVWLDGTALLLTLLAFLVSILCFYRIVRNVQSSVFHPGFLFSIAYLSIIGLATLFYSNTSQNTSVLSINRYVFATPFAGYFLMGLRGFEFSLKTKVIIVAFLSFTIMVAFGIFSSELESMKGMMYFLIYIIFYFIGIQFKEIPSLVILPINLYLLYLLLGRYMMGYWIG
ncbi:MAG: hypothetical protein KBB64_03130 [Bacteroidia bacterium]|jgi:hypothetical protein|nr:hypothetical protein [Bacteroidia bacterium]